MTTILVVIFIFILALIAWALYGKGEEPPKVREEKAEEKALRRRSADKMIEEQFPDSGSHTNKRKEDIEAIEEMSMAEDDFKLPYPANDIIPDGSKYWVYNRTLVNSEIYAKKGDFSTAISLYRGVYERVVDQNVNSKIRANVDYLQEYQKTHQKKKSETPKQKAGEKPGEKRGGEIRLTLDGDFAIPDKIQIALAPAAAPVLQQDAVPKFDINKIVDDIAEKVAAKQLPVSSKEEVLDSEIRKLKEKSEEVSKLKEGMLKLSDRLIDVYHETKEAKEGIQEMRSKLASGVEETKIEPKVTEARFQSSYNIQTVARIEEKIPIEQVPEPKKVEFGPSPDKSTFIHSREIESRSFSDGAAIEEKIPGERVPEQEKIDPQSFSHKAPPQEKIPEKTFTEPEKVELQQFTGKAAAGEKTRNGNAIEQEDAGLKREIQKVKEEEDDTEEIELLSQFEKEEEFSGLSDEDIFEKILKEDMQKKKDESFEIVGYDKSRQDASYDAMDKAMEDRQREEEQFYRKFLRHGKRVRKELPILKVSYDFSKLPDEFNLSKDQNILQFSFYKYKPMLEKANEFIKRRNVRDAINYYNVIKDQNIPPEFKVMLDKNINELTEYIERYLTAD